MLCKQASHSYRMIVRNPLPAKGGNRRGVTIKLVVGHASLRDIYKINDVQVLSFILRCIRIYVKKDSS